MKRCDSERLERFLPLVKGSLGWTRMKCGNLRCKCAHGELHTACYLSYRKQGKTHTVHIPKALATKIEQYCDNWKKLKELLENQTNQIVMELLQKYRKTGKPKAKKGDESDGKARGSKRSTKRGVG